MLEELRIQNLAVIEDTSLSFPTSYTALIGETGAGKSLIVDSLSLLTGERSDFSLVRDKTKKAVVSALFSLTDDFLKKHPELKDYVGEDRTLLVKRTLLPDKSTRCLLNDEPVTLATFKKVNAHLIDIHSQGSHSDLLDPEKQLTYLDRYAGKKLESALASYEKAYDLYLGKKKELADLIAQNKELDRDYLTFQIQEIEKYHLQENEIEDLNAEYNSLRSYDRLKEKYEEFLSVTDGQEGSLSDRLGSVESRLMSFRGTELEEPAKQALEACRAFENGLNDLNETFSSLSGDPRRIDEINQRLFDLKGLQRKYGRSTAEILSKLKDYKEKLALSDSFESDKQGLEKEIDKAHEDVLKKADELTAIRTAASAKLASSIGAEMASLGLRKNAFRIDIKEGELTSLGKDKVTFYVSLNEGLEEAPLAKAASGGEASRLLLALKVVLNALDPYDLLVFDEIDTGVSGKTASLVAKKIKSISASSQVLVISHLPQVVASAASAIKIKKTTIGGTTSTVATSLDEPGFNEAVAVMLSGDKVTPAALKAAEELVKEYR